MKDPGFIFYPGDYLRDTQNLGEKTQVAYDRIMCEHMRNICISKSQLKFFTKRLNDDEVEELMMMLTESEDGFQIEWVAESINKRRAYSESRRRNRTKKKKEDVNNVSKTYVPHMENENENENENTIKGGVGENSKPIEGNVELMGFIGQCRHWLETEQRYIWGLGDDPAIKRLEYKIKRLQQIDQQPTQKEYLVERFKKLMLNLPQWVQENKYSLHYIDKNFNEIKNGQNAESGKRHRKSGSKLGVKTVFGDGGEL